MTSGSASLTSSSSSTPLSESILCSPHCSCSVSLRTLVDFTGVFSVINPLSFTGFPEMTVRLDSAGAEFLLDTQVGSQVGMTLFLFPVLRLYLSS